MDNMKSEDIILLRAATIKIIKIERSIA